MSVAITPQLAPKTVVDPTRLSILPADRIVGMMHVTQLLWLAERASHSTRIVDVGCYRGRSTRALCDNTPGHVWAVDTWDGSPELSDELTVLRTSSGDPDWLYHEFQRNMEGVSNLTTLRMPSLDAAAMSKADGQTYDMVHLDALHDFSSVCADIRAWWPLISSPGILCGHDLEHPPVLDAVCECFPQFPRDLRGTIWAVYKTSPDQGVR